MSGFAAQQKDMHFTLRYLCSGMSRSISQIMETIFQFEI
jgi:hypothetical protein